MKRDVTVSLYRVIATLFILLCHLGTHYENGLLSMGFLVGVEMFLLLSGYLAARGMSKPRDLRYLGRRYVRMMQPVWIFVLLYAAFALCLRRNGVLDFLPYLGGVFGLPRLHGADYFAKVQGLTHLWYITAALLCELVALPALWLKRTLGEPRRLYYAVAIPAVLGLYLLSGLTPIRFDYLLVFACGIFFFEILEKPVGKGGFVLSGAVLLFAFALRLVAMRLIDGTHFYTNTVIPLTYLMIAFALFVELRFLASGPMRALCERLAKGRVCGFLERCSYEIYISHYVFIVGPLCVFALALPEAVKILLFIACSLVAAYLLHLASRAVDRWCKKR